VIALVYWLLEAGFLHSAQQRGTDKELENQIRKSAPPRKSQWLLLARFLHMVSTEHRGARRWWAAHWVHPFIAMTDITHQWPLYKLYTIAIRGANVGEILTKYCRTLIKSGNE